MRTSERVARDVAAALDASATNVKRMHPARWTYELKNGKIFPGTATIEGPWLAFEAAPRSRTDRAAWCPWRALRTGSGLGGLAKVALSGDAPLVRADLALPPEPGPSLHAAIRDVCRAIESAAYAFRPSALETPPPADAQPAAELPFEDRDAGEPLTRLARLAQESGWPCAERADGSVAVELGIPHPRFEATLMHDHPRDLSVRTRVARFARVSDTSRRALGRFLLEANAGVRLAGATAVDSREGIEIAFEARLPADASAEQLGHALSALTVAAAAWGVETRALSSERLASRFLAARGDAGRRSTTRSTRKSRR